MANAGNNDPIAREIARLQRPQRGRRLLSWLLLIATLGGFLFLPILASEYATQVSRLIEGWTQGGPLASLTKQSAAQRRGFAETPDAPAPTALALDVSWNPGPLASAHTPWAHDCKVCHSTSFVRVQDKDCLTCHRGIGDHVAREAGEVQGISDVRCASCHRDHKGAFALASQNLHFTGEACAACHGDIKTSLPATQTENVRDFADAHPEFRIQLRTDPSGETLKRVRPDDAGSLSEPTNLKFPHDVHLATAGIASPKGEVRMACDNCHTPDPDGLGFAPVTMRDHCQSCHALRMEPLLSAREVPHGPVADVLSTLREFYAYVAARGGLPPTEPRPAPPIEIKRPGEASRAPASFLATAGDPRSRAAAAATALFEKTSCVVCHEVSRRSAPGADNFPGADLPQWEIAPIAKDHAWMPQSVFNHRAHATAKCSDCHAAASSEKATEVLMPRIAVCRDCHAGATPVKDKVTSDCGVCHGFHQPSRLPPPGHPHAPRPLASTPADAP